MSVYCGFATRQQETFYLKLVEKCLQLLSYKAFVGARGSKQPLLSHEITAVHLEETAWASKMVRLYKTMRHMEHYKYLEPHFSLSIKPIVGFMINKQVRPAAE